MVAFFPFASCLLPACFLLASCVAFLIAVLGHLGSSVLRSNNVAMKLFTHLLPLLGFILLANAVDEETGKKKEKVKSAALKHGVNRPALQDVQKGGRLPPGAKTPPSLPARKGGGLRGGEPP